MKIDRIALLDRLTLLSRTVATTDKVPLYETFCFRDSMIRTFDGACGTLCRYDAGIEACVDAEQLMQLLKTIEGDFELLQDAEKRRVIVKTERAKQSIPLQPAANFPDFIPKSYDMLLGAKSGISDAISKVLALTDETRTPQYSGVAINGRYVYALDGSRATRSELTASVPSDYTIPTRAARRIAEMGDPSGVVGNRNCVAASYGEILFYTQLNAVSLPTKQIDQQFLLTDVPGAVAEFPESFAKALHRSRIFANEKTSGVHLTCHDSKLIISSRSDGRGECTEEMDCTIPIDFDVYVQPSHLLEVLRLTRKFNYANLVKKDARCIRFEGDKFLHLVCLMSPTI